MKNKFLYFLLLIEILACQQKQHIWEYKVLPRTCYADAFFIQPDFKPNGYVIEVNGVLNQDVVLTVSGTQSISDYSEKRNIGYNHYIKLSKGAVAFSDSSELYVNELKVILSGSDTTLYPNPESEGTLRCLPLGDIKVKLTLN